MPNQLKSGDGGTIRSLLNLIRFGKKKKNKEGKIIESLAPSVARKAPLQPSTAPGHVGASQVADGNLLERKSPKGLPPVALDLKLNGVGAGLAHDDARTPASKQAESPQATSSHTHAKLLAALESTQQAAEPLNSSTRLSYNVNLADLSSVLFSQRTHTRSHAGNMPLPARVADDSASGEVRFAEGEAVAAGGVGGGGGGGAAVTGPLQRHLDDAAQRGSYVPYGTTTVGPLHSGGALTSTHDGFGCGGVGSSAPLCSVPANVMLQDMLYADYETLDSMQGGVQCTPGGQQHAPVTPGGRQGPLAGPDGRSSAGAQAGTVPLVRGPGHSSSGRRDPRAPRVPSMLGPGHGQSGVSPGPPGAQAAAGAVPLEVAVEGDLQGPGGQQLHPQQQRTPEAGWGGGLGGGAAGAALQQETAAHPYVGGDSAPVPGVAVAQAPVGHQIQPAAREHQQLQQEQQQQQGQTSLHVSSPAQGTAEEHQGAALSAAAATSGHTPAPETARAAAEGGPRQESGVAGAADASTAVTSLSQAAQLAGAARQNGGGVAPEGVEVGLGTGAAAIAGSAKVVATTATTVTAAAAAAAPAPVTHPATDTVAPAAFSPQSTRRPPAPTSGLTLPSLPQPAQPLGVPSPSASAAASAADQPAPLSRPMKLTTACLAAYTTLYDNGGDQSFHRALQRKMQSVYKWLHASDLTAPPDPRLEVPVPPPQSQPQPVTATAAAAGTGQSQQGAGALEKSVVAATAATQHQQQQQVAGSHIPAVRATEAVGAAGLGSAAAGVGAGAHGGVVEATQDQAARVPHVAAAVPQAAGSGGHLPDATRGALGPPLQRQQQQQLAAGQPGRPEELAMSGHILPQPGGPGPVLGQVAHQHQQQQHPGSYQQYQHQRLAAGGPDSGPDSAVAAGDPPITHPRGSQLSPRNHHLQGYPQQQHQQHQQLLYHHPQQFLDGAAHASPQAVEYGSGGGGGSGPGGGLGRGYAKQLQAPGPGAGGIDLTATAGSAAPSAVSAAAAMAAASGGPHPEALLLQHSLSELYGSAPQGPTAANTMPPRVLAASDDAMSGVSGGLPPALANAATVAAATVAAAAATTVVTSASASAAPSVGVQEAVVPTAAHHRGVAAHGSGTSPGSPSVLASAKAAAAAAAAVAASASGGGGSAPVRTKTIAVASHCPPELQPLAVPQPPPPAAGGESPGGAAAGGGGGGGASSSSLVGSWSIEDFSLLKKLYEGSLSVVCQAQHRRSGRHVALKIYKRSRLHEMERFQLAREICLHIRIVHPHVVGLFAAWKDSKYVYLALDWAPQGNMFDFLVARGGRLGEEEAARLVMRPLMSALAFLHSQHFIHRDVKLENLLLDASFNLKLADFGLAIDQKFEQANTRLGTFGYFAPEVLDCPLKKGPFDLKDASVPGYDSRVDVWSAGVVGYEVLTGRAPFSASSPSKIIQAIRSRVLDFPGISEEGQDFLRAALTRDPAARPTAKQLLHHPWLVRHCGPPAATSAVAAAAAAAAAGMGSPRMGPVLLSPAPPLPVQPPPGLHGAEDAAVAVGSGGAGGGAGRPGAAAGVSHQPSPGWSPHHQHVQQSPRQQQQQGQGQQEGAQAAEH